MPDLQKEARQSVPDFAGQRRELSESIQAAFIDILAGKTLRNNWPVLFTNGALVARCCRNNRDCRASQFSPELGAQRRPWQRLKLRDIGVMLAVFFSLQTPVEKSADYERQFSPKRTEFSKPSRNSFAKAIDAFCAVNGQKGSAT